MMNNLSPMLGPDIVKLYTSANKAYNPASALKGLDDAVALRALIALELQFMVGCDCYWTFDDDEAPAAAGAAQIEINTDRNVLQPAAAADDDTAPAAAPGSPQVDPHDITKWNVLELAAIPITAQNFAQEIV